MEMQQNEERELGIGLELTFEGNPPSALMTDIVQVCEREIHASLKGEMEVVLDGLEVPGYVRTRCREVFDNLSGQSLRFTSAREGSIVLYAGLTALGFWVIQNTLGETFKEAYKESGMHERLKEILLSRRKKQAEDIGSTLAGRLTTSNESGLANISVRIGDSGDRTVVNVSITISEEHARLLPPTIDDWYNKE